MSSKGHKTSDQTNLHKFSFLISYLTLRPQNMISFPFNFMHWDKEG